MSTGRFLLVLVGVVAWSALGAQGAVAPVLVRPPAWDAPRVGVYDTVARTLRNFWPDSVVLWHSIEPLLMSHKAAADLARRFGDEVAVVRRMLEQIPSTNVTLTSATAAQSITRALAGQSETMFGMELMHWNGQWYAATVLDGGPAALAGVQRWDEVLAIDGVRPEHSGRLDYRTDDASLDDAHDPPMHGLLADDRPTTKLRLRRTVRDTIELSVTATRYSALEGTQESVRVMEIEGAVRVGVVHLWYLHSDMRLGYFGWFSNLFGREWTDVDAVMLDLRGRGGTAEFARDIADVLTPGRLQRFRGPVVVLQDRQTRSAKELLIDILRERKAARLVGEPTAGSLVSSVNRSIGHGLVLTMPAPGRQPPEASRLEMHPIAPDVAVSWGGPMSATDPIFEAGLIELRRLINDSGRGAVLPPAPPQDPSPKHPLEPKGAKRAP